MACSCLACSGLKPATPEQARNWMQFWLFVGNLTNVDNAGNRQLLAMDAHSDVLASQMVLGGFGLRRWHGIELNAAGLAIWNEVHP